MSYDRDRLLTYCGITAPLALWSANHFEIAWKGEPATEYVSGGPHNHQAELAAARLGAGADDWRALAWLRTETDRRHEEMTRATGIARLAEALTKISQTGKESVLNELIGQLTERTQYAVRQQLRR